MSDNPEKLSDKLELHGLSPRDKEAQVERERVEAANLAAEAKNNKDKAQKERAARRSTINKKQRNESYARTIKRVQTELPASSRLFSKIIHNRYVERISDIISSTIARPNAMLYGSIVAFVLTLFVYTTSKTIGYNLSGSETIVAFIVGWIIGIIFDYIKVLITGKKS